MEVMVTKRRAGPPPSTQAGYFLPREGKERERGRREKERGRREPGGPPILRREAEHTSYREQKRQERHIETERDRRDI